MQLTLARSHRGIASHLQRNTRLYHGQLLGFSGTWRTSGSFSWFKLGQRHALDMRAAQCVGLHWRQRRQAGVPQRAQHDRAGRRTRSHDVRLAEQTLLRLH